MAVLCQVDMLWAYQTFIVCGLITSAQRADCFTKSQNHVNSGSRSFVLLGPVGTWLLRGLNPVFGRKDLWANQTELTETTLLPSVTEPREPMFGRTCFISDQTETKEYNNSNNFLRLKSSCPMHLGHKANHNITSPSSGIQDPFNFLCGGCRLFHILGILSLYAKDPIFLITGNRLAFLKVSFLASRSELMFVPSTHTRSPSLYSMTPSRLVSAFLFITSFVFLRASSTSLLASLILWTNSSTSGIFSIDAFPCLWMFGCLPRFTNNGDFPVLECCLLLCTNLVVLSAADIQPEVLFHFLVGSLCWPSVWGW